MTIARLLAYRRILLSARHILFDLLTMVEEDLRARGWRCERDISATTQDRRAP